MSKMKAVRIHSYGGSEVLAFEEAPRPAPGGGEVLIRVIATSVNPFDVAMRSGYMASFFNTTLPFILGTDVSGTIEKLGEGTNSFKPGDAVYTRAGVTRDGAYAEFVTAAASDVAAKPRTLDHFHAAAIPHVSLTAWQALFVLADLKPWQTVLVHGAAGGVGHIAIQLARWRGAKVIGTASQNMDLLRQIGVDQAIDYSTTPFEQVVKDVDVVLDTVGGDTQERSWQVLKPGGILISVIQQPSQDKADAHGVRQAMVYSAPPIGEVLTEMASLIDSGVVKPHVSAVIPLSEVNKAHQMVESRHTGGKVVLQVAQ
jgi:NADPH:quinone reductase-like Zn-dependent oxidoreductase